MVIGHTPFSVRSHCGIPPDARYDHSVLMSGMEKIGRRLRSLGFATPGMTVPLVALLGRKLSDPEQDAVASRLTDRASTALDELTTLDVATEIMRVTDGLPIESDLAAVMERLRVRGVPVAVQQQQLR